MTLRASQVRQKPWQTGPEDTYLTPAPHTLTAGTSTSVQAGMAMRTQPIHPPKRLQRAYLKGTGTLSSLPPSTHTGDTCEESRDSGWLQLLGVFSKKREKKKTKETKNYKRTPRKSHRGKLLPQKLNLLAQPPAVDPTAPKSPPSSPSDSTLALHSIPMVLGPMGSLLQLDPELSLYLP